MVSRKRSIRRKAKGKVKDKGKKSSFDAARKADGHKSHTPLKSSSVVETRSGEESTKKGNVTPGRKAAQAAISRLKSSPAILPPLERTRRRESRNLPKSEVVSVSASLPPPSSATAIPFTAKTGKAKESAIGPPPSSSSKKGAKTATAHSQDTNHEARKAEREKLPRGFVFDQQSMPQPKIVVTQSPALVVVRQTPKLLPPQRVIVHTPIFVQQQPEVVVHLSPTKYSPPRQSTDVAPKNGRHLAEAKIDNGKPPFHVAILERRRSDSDPSLDTGGIGSSGSDQAAHSHTIRPQLPEDTPRYEKFAGGASEANMSQTAIPSSEAPTLKEVDDQGEVVASKGSERSKRSKKRKRKRRRCCRRKKRRGRSRSHRSSENNCRRSILIAAIIAAGFLVVGLCIGLGIYFSSVEKRKGNKK